MLREGGGLVQEHPAFLGVVGAGGPQDPLLALLAEAFEGGQITFFEPGDLPDARGPELPPQATRGARADAGQAGDLDEAGGHLFEKIREDLGGAVLGEVPNRRGRGPSDVGQALEVLHLARRTAQRGH